MSTKSKTETKNSFEHIPTPITPEIKNAQSVANNLRGAVDPQIRYDYANARTDFNSQFHNPSGKYTTQAERDAMHRAGLKEMAQDETNDTVQGAFDANDNDFQRQKALAQLTAPKLVQTGGTTTSTQGGLGTFTDAILGGAANIAGSYLSQRTKPTAIKYGKPQTMSAGGITTTTPGIALNYYQQELVPMPPTPAWLG